MVIVGEGFVIIDGYVGRLVYVVLVYVNND